LSAKILTSRGVRVQNNAKNASLRGLKMKPVANAMQPSASSQVPTMKTVILTKMNSTTVTSAPMMTMQTTMTTRLRQLHHVERLAAKSARRACRNVL
jgi:hypothetical protein